MTLKEIKKQIKTAPPEHLVTLAIEFEMQLEKLSEFHVDYRDFHNENYTELSYLRATADPDNAIELMWFVDAVIEIDKKLQQSVAR